MLTETPEIRRSRPARAPSGTTYRVVAARKGAPFRDTTFSGAGSNPLEWVFGLVIDVVMDVRAGSSPSWKVGVIRVGRLWEKCVHKELLAPGLDPAQRMTELADSVAQGHLG
jgi:hypothetical protein